SEQMEAQPVQAQEANGGQPELASAEPGIEPSETNGIEEAPASSESAAEQSGDERLENAPASDEAGTEQSECAGTAALVEQPSQESAEHEPGADAGSECDTAADVIIESTESQFGAD